MGDCSGDWLGNCLEHCSNEVPCRADREWVRALARKQAAVASGVRSQAHNQVRYGQWFASETVKALESKAFANQHPVSWRSKIIASKMDLKTEVCVCNSYSEDEKAPRLARRSKRRSP